MGNKIRDFQKLLEHDILGIVDIMLDEKTNCLKVRDTNKEIETEYKKVEYKDLKSITCKNGWRFKWKDIYRNGFDIYSLHIMGDDVIQGLVSIKMDADNETIYISNIESAPHNMGKSGQYIGVGTHLFAIAIKMSIDNGFNGFVDFDAKTDLIEYYKEKLHAQQIGTSQRMYIDCEDAKKICDIYFGGGKVNE